MQNVQIWHKQRPPKNTFLLGVRVAQCPNFLPVIRGPSYAMSFSVSLSHSTYLEGITKRLIAAKEALAHSLSLCGLQDLVVRSHPAQDPESAVGEDDRGRVRAGRGQGKSGKP